jgi:SAM-dependent methyltransferase
MQTKEQTASIEAGRPSIEVVDVTTCDLCRSSSWDEVYSGLDHPGRSPLRIVRCRKCGLMTQNPRRSVTAAQDHYGAIEMVSTEEADAEMEKRRVGYEVDLLRLASLTQGRRLLDVGCSTGDFLRVARDAGWDAWGVEPSKAQSDFARDRRGLRVRTGILDPADWKGQAFDAVTLNFVLEHIPDPRPVLSASLAVLAPGGVLFVMVPNCGALEVRTRMKLGRFQGSREADAGHAYFYTRSTLAAFVEAAGGKVIRQRDGIGGVVFVRRAPAVLRAAQAPVMAGLDVLDRVTSLPSLGTTLRVWAVRGDQPPA